MLKLSTIALKACGRTCQGRLAMGRGKGARFGRKGELERRSEHSWRGVRIRTGDSAETGGQRTLGMPVGDAESTQKLPLIVCPWQKPVAMDTSTFCLHCMAPLAVEGAERRVVSTIRGIREGGRVRNVDRGAWIIGSRSLRRERRDPAQGTQPAATRHAGGREPPHVAGGRGSPGSRYHRQRRPRTRACPVIHHRPQLGGQTGAHRSLQGPGPREEV